MKVTEKKLDDGRILLEAVASTAEVSHALTMAQYGFAQQMGMQIMPGMSVAQAAEQQLGIKDLDAIVQQQADRKSTRLNSSHMSESRMPSSA